MLTCSISLGMFSHPRNKAKTDLPAPKSKKNEQNLISLKIGMAKQRRQRLMTEPSKQGHLKL